MRHRPTWRLRLLRKVRSRANADRAAITTDHEATVTDRRRPRLKTGENTVDVKCADDEPMKACSDILMQILDRALPKQP